MWWIFFQTFKEINGWKVEDMAALWAIVFGAYGLMQIFFGGYKFISRTILNGDLDPYMTQPKNLLIHLLASRSHPKGYGNFLCMIVFLS